MDDQHYPAGDECPYSWLNEWLCEYVDGTMDPSLQRMFEAYVQANPELKEHIQELKRTRHLLCRCSDPPSASDEVRARVQGKVECEMLRTPRSLKGTIKEYPVTTMASSMAVALVIGMFAGATFLAPSSLSPVSAAEDPAVVSQDTTAERSRSEQPPVLRSTTRSLPTFRAFEPSGQEDLLPQWLIEERHPPMYTVAPDTTSAGYERVRASP